MKICVINGSPRGKNSVTLQTVLYLEKRFPQHSFDFLNVGAGIQSFERDMSGAVEAIRSAELLLFSYPVYTFLAPSQLHRFLELMKRSGVDFKDIYATQLTTSKHFFDVTAHRYLEENCRDMGMRVIHGLSADMEDLLTEQGRREAEDFLRYAVYCVENQLYEPAPAAVAAPDRPAYVQTLSPGVKPEGFDTVIVGDLQEEDASLRAMIKDFRALYPYQTRFVNLADFPFKGGCLGCFGCAADGRCIQKDGFDAFLRENIQNADAIIYAFTLRDHSMGSRFKMYDDRQFCNGHRTVTEGKPFAYIANGDYEAEENLKTVIEARAQVGHNFLAGVGYDLPSMEAAAKRLAYALENRYVPPRNFYGVGGMKIFRDLIWLMRGIMKADHDYYKAHGLYDFPQKHRGRMLAMSLLGILLRSDAAGDKVRAKFNQGMMAPYKKLLARTRSGK